MNSENLDFLTDDDIDYSNLSEDVLRELALGDELFIATSALVELRLRKNAVAATIAREILSKSLGDKYLQATALSVLFDMNQEQAINFMLKQAQDSDSYLLNTIMELMIENEADFKSEPASSIVNIVKDRLLELSNSKRFPEPEVKEKFLHLYGYVGNIYPSPV
ncbi:MAG: hypothetical protein SAK29_09300 [Scytonema sp. PMC 1069.18]|nr:hypothetical protein [Scytonema sp. PMC 1069.18]MEC4884488.1 hypothetical protein [Scytonema sp. PMC 1070.18]